MKSFLQATAAIFAKDVRLEARTRQTVTSVFVFALLIAFVFNFAFRPAPGVMALVGPGIIWAAYVFAGMLGLGRTFVLERERGTLEGLLLAPVGHEAVFLGKLLSAFAVMLVVEVLMVPVFLVLYDLSLVSFVFVATVLLATVGFAAVGTLFSAISAQTRAREVLLPLLFLPVVLPVIMGAVAGTSAAIEPSGGDGVGQWLQLMLAFDILFLVISSWAFSYVIEE